MQDRFETQPAKSRIDILDSEGVRQATIETDRPAWSFAQYCRNRETAGWAWQASQDGQCLQSESNLC